MNNVMVHQSDSLHPFRSRLPERHQSRFTVFVSMGIPDCFDVCFIKPKKILPGSDAGETKAGCHTISSRCFSVNAKAFQENT